MCTHGYLLTAFPLPCHHVTVGTFWSTVLHIQSEKEFVHKFCVVLFPAQKYAASVKQQTSYVSFQGMFHDQMGQGNRGLPPDSVTKNTT